MLDFTIYTADCIGNSGNCLYPNKIVVTDKDAFIKAIKILKINYCSPPVILILDPVIHVEASDKR